jgi:thymidine kinase
LTHTFEGSHRLFEVADSITEIKTICKCGKKAIVNARIDGEGRVLTRGGQILLGGNDSYVAMCHSCWKKAIGEQEKKGNEI